ncbi:MAG: magnesium chelatase domain-containing protein, partial [Rubrobacter sp.]
NLSDQDVYVNVTGGVRVEEPAADLGVALAIASALSDRPVGKGAACFGEIGLTGDVRFVPGADRRAGELIKLGFARIIRPEKLEGRKKSRETKPSKQADNTLSARRGEDSLLEVKTLEEAVAVALL